MSFRRTGPRALARPSPRVQPSETLASGNAPGCDWNDLDYYLDEFTFRFNRRSSRSRGLLFYRLLEQAVKVRPVPYKRLIADVDDDFSFEPDDDLPF